ncbi:spermidine synthase [bacterium]|nr:spermidine synthase [bacterium]
MSKPNIEFLAYEETPLGTICLRRRELLSQPGVIVTEVTLNHEFLMSSLYTDSEQELSRIAIEMHGGDQLRVMVAGLGLGYSAFEALKSEQVEHVEVIELLPQVIGWMKDGLIPLSPQLSDNPRLSVTPADAYAKLASVPETKYDLILIDIDHSPDDRLGAGDNIKFYSSEGLSYAKKHLQPGGVLGVWSYAENSPFADALRESFNTVRVEPVTHQNELIHEEHTDWLFFASD